MNKFIISAIVSLAFVAPASTFAYTLPTPVKVATSTPVSLGEKHPDFSKPSSITGTFEVNTIENETAQMTVGNFNFGNIGYGYFLKDQFLYGLVQNGGLRTMVLLGFVHPNTPITISASYTPQHGVKFDTYSINPEWNQFSRGIIEAGIGGSVFDLSALDSSIVRGDAGLTVNSWTFNQ
jgi:hypothetical protein